MNTCDLIIEWLDDYLDGTLSEDHRATFEAHLKSCDTCQSLVLDLQSMKEVLSDMPLMALPTDFNETLHEKIFGGIVSRFSKLIDDADEKSKLFFKINKFFEVVTFQKGIGKIVLDFSFSIISIILGLIILFPIFVSGCHCL